MTLAFIWTRSKVEEKGLSWSLRTLFFFYRNSWICRRLTYGFDMIVPFCCSELGGIFFGEIFAVITNLSFIAVRGLVSGKISPLTRLHLMLAGNLVLTTGLKT